MTQHDDDRRIAELRRTLLDQRARVQREIDESLAAYRTGQQRMRDESVSESEDESLRNSMADQRLSLMESRHRIREQFDDALRRLDEGTYGRCAQCGQPIGEARLRAVPFAQRCIKCQEEAEMIEQIERAPDRETI